MNFEIWQAHYYPFEVDLDSDKTFSCILQNDERIIAFRVEFAFEIILLRAQARSKVASSNCLIDHLTIKIIVLLFKD